MNSEFDISSTLKKINFINRYHVEGRSSIADMFKPKKRCGIYILSFSNGEYYCGQAVDVTRRFIQHTKNHSDIVALYFKEVPGDCLNDEERCCIHTLEADGAYLRNIALTSIPHGECDFDLIMPEDQQEYWLSNLDYRDLVGPRMVDDILRMKYHRRFQRMMLIPGIEEAIGALRKYIQVGVPAVRRGEGSFWICSCMPRFSGELTIISRININWQEVFTACYDPLFKNYSYSFHMALTPFLNQSRVRSLNRRVRYLFSGVNKTSQKYVPGGQDQVNLNCSNIAAAMQLMDDPAILSAIRLFNLRLMRKGPSPSSRYHCLNLADRLVEN